MSKVKYPNKREIEAQVKEIIIRSDMFENTNEFDFDGYEPLVRKKSYFKTGISFTGAVVCILVLFIAVLPLFQHTDISSGRPHTDGGEFNDGLTKEETTAEYKNNELNDESKNESKNESKTEESVAENGSSSAKDEFEDSNDYGDEKNIAFVLSRGNIIKINSKKITVTRTLNNSVQVKIEYLIPVIYCNEELSDVNEYFNEAVESITNDIISRYGNIVKEKGELKDKVFVSYVMNYVGEQILHTDEKLLYQENFVSFAGLYKEQYYEDGEILSYSQENRQGVVYIESEDKLAEYSDIVIDYDEEMRKIAEHIYSEITEKELGANETYSNEYSSVENIIKTLINDNNWYMGEFGIVICCNNYKNSTQEDGTVKTYSELITISYDDLNSSYH